MWWSKNEEIIERLEAIEKSLYLINSEIEVNKYSGEHAYYHLNSQLDTINDRLIALLFGPDDNCCSAKKCKCLQEIKEATPHQVE